MTVETTRARNVVDEVRSWAGSDAMAALLALVERAGTDDDAPWLHLNEQLPVWLVKLLADTDGASSDPTIQLVDSLIALERRAADSFNFRSRDGSTYRERSEAVEADFDDATRARIVEYTATLGLVEATPPAHDTYDMTLILGGGFRSPLLRTRYAALLERQGIGLGDVYLLGSPRFLITNDPAERPVTSQYAPGAVDEFDLMVAAATSEFGLSPQPMTFLCGCASVSLICPSWRHRDSIGAAEVPPEYTHERSTSLTLSDGRVWGSAISASTSRPPYRPDTSDTLELLVRHADPTPGQRVLLVTTQVFVPFQRFDGLRRLYLPHGLNVDAVGFGADWGDRPQTAEYLLQETLSAIRSARRLLVDAVAILLSHAGHPVQAPPADNR
ncbi:hypothetical protein [Microbacterium candidum]|uniref:SIR2-like domain-containing protein n=1 Tax=Microbacterium candidum TaxID=3041922 RepID=A0ABT7MW28_9MICO|nr:hypothetical protein [Microbacterium sp. ASV49]MDL9978656.1 hypothetical protein [Microbacterium sp. ASV49]